MDNSSLRLYVNGEQVNSEKMQFELSKNNDAAYIGWESSTGSFNGIIDEMRISDEPRGAAHYQNYYSGTTPVIERYRENRSPEKVNDIRTIGGKDIRIILPDIGGVANIGVTLHDFTGAMLLRSFIPSDDNGMIIVKNSRKLPVGKYIVRITNGDALYKVTSVIVR